MHIEPLAAPLGAQVHGLKPGTLGATDAAALRDALADHGVLVIRSATEPMNASALEEVAESLGTPWRRDGSAVLETTNVAADGSIMAPAPAGHGATPWVADGSFLAVPPIAVLTLAVEVPTRGGQTQFADMRKALRLLPAEDRSEMATLSLVHVDPADADSHVQHRWIRVTDHGESLFMGTHASHIAGRDRADSQRWFEEIEAQLPVHDVFLEHRWEPGDLVLHDPRIVLHRTLGYDIANERRKLLTIAVCPLPTN